MKEGITMNFITNETIATIVINEKTGKYILTMYREKKVIFTKEYKTFAAAAAQQTRYQKKFNLL
jgi:hypothetical protein